MPPKVTNGQIADRLMALEQKFDDRHTENVGLLKEINREVKATNGRVNVHDTQIALINQELARMDRAEQRAPRTAVLKIGGAGAGLGAAVSKAAEWFLK